MTEIKPGKWRLKDGREVLVLARDDRAVLEWHPPDRSAIWWTQDRLDDAEYLGPAVIGEAPDYGEYPRYGDYWYKQCGNAIEYGNELERQCKELEAETVATRELLEKSEERCEELARDLEEADASFRRRALLAPNSGDPPPYWLSGVSCEVEGDLVIHRYKSVTVMVREESEMSCRNALHGRWWSKMPSGSDVSFDFREDAEAWCREQLEPKWREATEGDRGKACRVKDHESETWSGDKRTLVGRNENIVGGPWATVSSGGSLSGWRYCEVQD